MGEEQMRRMGVVLRLGRSVPTGVDRRAAQRRRHVPAERMGQQARGRGNEVAVGVDRSGADAPIWFRRVAHG